jgi:uncharacterized Zn finger protein (UPF0148 family)
MPTPRSILAALGVVSLVAFGAACGDDDGGGDDLAAYCAKVAEFEAMDEQPSDEELDEIIDLAPEEVRDDVSTLVEALKADEEPEGEELDTVLEAEERITAFEEENCGTGEATDSEETTGSDSATEE